MQERLKGILGKVKETWDKLSKQQKTLLISLVAVIIVALVIVGAVTSRKEMVELITCDSTSQSAEVKTLLEDNSIYYEVSSDGLTYSIYEEDEANASILLGSNSIPTEGYSIDNVFDGGFSTTEADKSKKYQLYLEEKLADQLETAENIKSASVTLSIPENDGTLIAENQDTYASIILGLDGTLEEEQAQGIARWIATAIGNDTTDNVLILDTSSNVLFSGGDTTSTIGNASTQLTYQQKAESMKRSEVASVIQGTNIYDNVSVGLNLVLNFDETEYTNHHYYVDEGQTQGYLDSRDEYNSTTTDGDGGVPGTDSNDENTTYVMENGDNSSTEVSDVSEDYVPSEEITKKSSSVGSIDYENSSVTAVAVSYKIYNEDELKANGTLDDMTFDEFVSANSDRVKVDVDEDLYAAVANATGFSEENITLVAYEVPFFQYSEGSSRSLTDWFEIILAVLIFVLLGFVVFRSTRKQETEEIQPELSVETLLETTKEATDELEDIGYNEKSETRVLIEKFVDENPEAVASLLRNWLDEEWGD
jgi:flagellar M-ring protein FliF